VIEVGEMRPFGHKLLREGEFLELELRGGGSGSEAKQDGEWFHEVGKGLTRW
jgi:hypothetical protein